MGDLERPDVLALLQSRVELVENLGGEPRSKSTIVEDFRYSRKTIDRTIDDLRSAGLVDAVDDDLVATQFGQLAARRYRSLLGDDWTAEDVELVARRRDVLAELRDGPLHKPDLVERLDHSRSTIDRAIAALEDVTWVARRTPGYVTTDDGDDALERYEKYCTDQDALFAARPVLRELPFEPDLPLELATDATVAVRQGRYRLFEAIADQLANVDEYRLALPKLVDSRHLRLCHAKVTGGDLDLELFVDADGLLRLREEFPHLVGELATSGSVRAYTGQPPDFALLHAVGRTDPDDRGESDEPGRPDAVTVVAYDGEVVGFLVSDHPAVVGWATDRLASLRDEGREATDELRTAPASAELPRLTGERLPPSLRSEGFVRVDDSFFANRESLSPATGWRAGLGLPEVDDDYAIERRWPEEYGESSAETVGDTILRALEDGEDVALLGPPGSGKSTICKRVAVEYARSRDGLVLYRESGRGRPFESVGALDAVVERTRGPVLILVEDAIRSATAEVFEVMRRYAGRADVSFLLDARESEWRDPGQVLRDARLTAFQREQVRTVYVPPLGEADCERLIARAERLLDEPIDVSANDLLESVRGVEENERVTPGSLVHLFHRFSHYADPLAAYQDRGAATTLDEHVDRVRTELDSLGSTAVDVGTTCCLLVASGIGVYEEYLYALAAGPEGDPDDVAAAVDVLEGEILFPTNDTATGYRTIHETWAARYLQRSLEDARAPRRVGRCLETLLGFADDPDRRERVARYLGGDAPALESIVSAPGQWADETLTNVFAVGRQYPKLAPMFGTSDGSTIEVPEVCSSEIRTRCIEWRGRMYAAAGHLQKADREFESLAERSETVSSSEAARVRFESLLGRSRVARRRGNLEVAEQRASAALREAESLDRTTALGKGKLELGRVAKEKGEYETADERLRESLTAFGDEDRRERATALDELAEIATRQSEYDEAEAFFERSRAVYLDVGDERGEAMIRKNFGEMAFERGDLPTARQQYLGALELVREIGDRGEEIALLESLGSVAAVTGATDEARDYCERALSIAREMDASKALPSILSQLGGVELQDGDPEAAADYHASALDRAEAIGDRHLEAKSLRNLASVRLEQNRFDDARMRASRGLEISREIGDRQIETACLQCLGTVETWTGNLTTSREHLETALELSREGNDPTARAATLCLLSRTLRRRGDLDEASDYAREYLALTRETGLDRGIGMGGETLLGLIALDRDDLDDADEHLADAIESAGDGSQEAAYALVVRARVALGRGDPDAAERYVSSASASASSERTIANCQRVRAGIARERGALERAKELLTTARNRFDSLDQYEQARTTALLGDVHLESGEPEPARSNYRSAVELFRDAGADHEAVDVVVSLANVCRRLDETQSAKRWETERERLLDHGRSG